MTPTTGQMRMVLKLEKPVKSADGAGGQDETYNDWLTLRGFLDLGRVYRKFETGYDESIKTYRCWIPWRNEIEAEMSKDVRIVYEARTFAVDTFTLVKEIRRLYLLTLIEVR